MCIICGNLNTQQVKCNGCEQMNDLKKNYKDLTNIWKDEYYQEYFHQIDQWKNKYIGKIQNNAALVKVDIEKLIQQIDQ
ncbi:unnamed protein product [Adineta steineri]|uniref:Uncharacterized protein n=1 Tax=Adineta steineri TaxID=433720 RepID=A0A814YD71_9BILA|nr:unnamed protein product [Adineta steineri]